MNNPYATPRTGAALERFHGPVGIGGWLIIPVAGLFLVPVRFLLIFLIERLPAVRDGGWMNWGPARIIEFGFDCAFVAFAIVLIGLLLAGSARFPRLFIAFAAINVVYVFGYAGLAGYLPLTATQPQQLVGEILRVVLLAAIWVPYMLRSKRVRNTFRAGGPISE
jgi:hypothetical protein